MLALKLGVPPPLVATMLSQLTEDEREIVPWHRVVAKGGAIGRGPHRERQFARLIQEGIVVSPAGIVQDLARVMTRRLTDRSAQTKGAGRSDAANEARRAVARNEVGS